MGNSLMVVTAVVAAVIIEHLLHARLSPSPLSHSVYTEPLLQAGKSRPRIIMSLVSQLTSVWTKIQAQAVQFQSSLHPELATSPDTPTEWHLSFIPPFRFSFGSALSSGYKPPFGANMLLTPLYHLLNSSVIHGEHPQPRSLYREQCKVAKI